METNLPNSLTWKIIFINVPYKDVYFVKTSGPLLNRVKKVTEGHGGHHEILITNGLNLCNYSYRLVCSTSYL